MPFQRERNAVASRSRQAAIGSKRFAVKLAWDGTHYKGFQAQPHKNTIQDQVEDQLKSLLRRKSLRIFGWGRTDGGVHARGAVVTVDLTLEEVNMLATTRTYGENQDDHDDAMNNTLAASTILSALKAFPCSGGIGSITAIAVTPIAFDFDPRFSSLWKRYVYYISCNSKLRSPFVGRYAWQMSHDLDVEKMAGAAGLLSGRHTFSWLSVTEEGEQRDPVRDLELNVESIAAGPFSITGEDGTTLLKISGRCHFFQYRMMRRLVGALTNIGKDRVDMEQLKKCIEQFDQGLSAAVPVALKELAPAHGLCLDHIEYEVPIF